MDRPEILNHLEKVADIDDEIQDIVPYLKTVIRAYTWARRKRIETFLRSLDTVVTKWDPKRRERFENYVLSSPGTEILADYSDTVLLTGSRIAQAAMGLLFADFEHHRFSLPFKRHAVAALRGCSDQLVELFIQLLELPLKRQEGAPYTVRLIYDGDRERHEPLQLLTANEGELIGFTNDLMRRGLLLPDHAPNRAGASDPHWFFVFGVGEDSHRYVELFKDARELQP